MQYKSSCLEINSRNAYLFLRKNKLRDDHWKDISYNSQTTREPKRSLLLLFSTKGRGIPGIPSSLSANLAREKLWLMMMPFVNCRWKRDAEGNKVTDGGKPILEFVAIKRRDNGIWALPGVLDIAFIYFLPCSERVPWPSGHSVSQSYIYFWSGIYFLVC